MISEITLSLIFFLTGLSVLFVLNRYGNLKRGSAFVFIVIFISWFFPFSSFVLLPLDLLSTEYTNCIQENGGNKICEKPFLFVDRSILYILWRLVYWTSFVLTWLLIPILQTYITQKGRDWRNKLRWAIVRQLLYFLIAGALGILFVGYVMYKKKMDTLNALKLYLVSISNCWALVLIIAFMGYGLVDVPKKLWIWSLPRKRLELLELKAPLVYEKLSDSNHAVRDAVDKVLALMEKIHSTHPLREYLDDILATPGLDLKDHNYFQSSTELPNPIDAAFLDDVDYSLKNSLKEQERNRALWRSLREEAFHIQDVLSNAESSDRRLTSTLTILSGSKWDDFRISLAWWFYVIIQPILLRLASCITSFLTVGLLWSELTLSFKSFSIVSRIFSLLDDQLAVLQLISAILLLYMSWCAYSSLFQLKVFNYYVLVPNKHTDENSLLFCGAYLCRLAIPLYYNFLLLSSSDQKNLANSPNDIVFSDLMGKMDLVPFLGSMFNQLVPFLILIPVGMSLTGVNRRITRFFSIDFLLVDDASPQGLQRRGRELLKSERTREERSMHNSHSASLSPLPPTRSIAIEISSPGGHFSDSEDEETPIRRDESSDMSTSQKIKKFFGTWRFASSTTSPENLHSVYQDYSDLNESFEQRPLR
ncbi:hypothetical protein DSO57_1036790 [Entomophthora muscae]|uniref:Uncharacterized protein n=1 Tax=Entomophthora muscae TaxID=34485 RepID=A0ACC2RQ68_9FUNG|nr:hypothetical protein DSO57_1036790 [Entomophthora muscae]